MLYTTLEQLHKHHACTERYKVLVEGLGGVGYGKQTPIPITRILDICGLDDALWTLRSVPEDQQEEVIRISVILALEFAERSLPYFELYPDDSRVKDCLALVKRFTNGEKISEEELRAAYVAYAADADYTAYAAYATFAAYVARAASVTNAIEMEWQANKFREILEVNNEMS